MNKYSRIIFLYFILSVLYIPLTQSIPNSLSLSPSFERQEIGDVKSGGDWIFWPSNNEEEGIVSKNGQVIDIPTANKELQCIFNMPISPDIKSVSYTSDGDRLNASIWVSEPLLDRILLKNDIDSENYNSNTTFLPLWHKLKFTMAIDVFSIFNEGIDYRVDLFNEKINSTHNQWIKQLYEISADDTSKVLSTEYFDEFPYQQNEFVDFSVDLKSISNPQKYRILFYITDLYVKDGKLCRMVDSTNWVLSPPPEFNVVVSPNSIFMRPGDEKDITVTISGDTAMQSKGILNVNDTNSKEDAIIKFLSNETVISSFANGSSILNIKIPNTELIKSKHLIIPINANISFPTDIINKGNETFYNNKSISLLEHSNLVLTVLPSLTVTERLGEIANTLKPIGDLWQITFPIVTALIAMFVYLYKKRSNKDKKEKNNKKIDEL